MPGTFTRALELDRLDARAGAAVSEYLAARWRERRRGVDAAPPLPAMFADAATRNRLERWRGESRRAEMLWRWFALAGVEADARVRGARRGGDGAAVLAARTRAARALGWPSFWELGLALTESPDPDDVRGDVVAGASQIDLDATDPPGAILARLREQGLAVDGVALDVVLEANPDTPIRARTFPVQPPGDVRVYVRGPRDRRGARAVAHELGHALYARHHDPGAPRSLRAAPSRALDEAVAFAVEALAIGADPDAPAAQRRRAERERAAYAGSAADVRPWMLDDPMAQPAYLHAHAIAAALCRAVRGLRPADRGAWLIERVFRAGAGRSTADLVARIAPG